MPAKVFFDTSILIYLLISNDPGSLVAESLLLAGGTVSVQVLNEFVSVSRRKLKLGWDEIEIALSSIRTFCQPPVSLTAEIHDSAVRIAKRYGFNIYDSLIIASAVDAGSSVLYSEDMQHGQKIEGLTIINPFPEL